MHLKSILRRFKKRCHSCGEGRLVTINFMKATCVDEEGKRYPNAWSFVKCDRCGCRLKIYVNGRVETPTDEEWNTACRERKGFVRDDDQEPDGACRVCGEPGFLQNYPGAPMSDIFCDKHAPKGTMPFVDCSLFLVMLLAVAALVYFLIFR